MEIYCRNTLFILEHCKLVQIRHEKDLQYTDLEQDTEEATTCGSLWNIPINKPQFRKINQTSPAYKTLAFWRHVNGVSWLCLLGYCHEH